MIPILLFHCQLKVRTWMRIGREFKGRPRWQAELAEGQVGMKVSSIEAQLGVKTLIMDLDSNAGQAG